MNDRQSNFIIIFLCASFALIIIMATINGEDENDFDTMCVAAGGTTIRYAAHAQHVCVNTLDIIELENR